MTTTTNPPAPRRTLLLLCTTTGYQTRMFADAAARLGIDVVFGSDRCHVLDDPWQDGALPLRFEELDASVRTILDYAATHPLSGIIALGDRPTPVAARACAALRLPSHPAAAADLCRDKSGSRETLRAAGLNINIPAAVRFAISDDPTICASAAESDVGFPCVLKPLALSGSRGVIRADDPAQFVAAFERIRALLRSADVQVLREPSSGFIQAETFIPGNEVAVEAVMQRGSLRVLAIFDKPGPMDGPFFEETIYVTPSRLSAQSQHRIQCALQDSVHALGLFHGPIHAEFRINDAGVWPLEIAARPIGGLCARALRFHFSENAKDAPVPLEELLVRLSMDEDVSSAIRETAASGVMMLPIPSAGSFEEVRGVEAALAVSGI